ALALVLAACEGEGIDFATQPLACRPAPATEAVEADEVILSGGEMATVLQDVLSRLNPSFAAGDAREAIQTVLGRLAAALPQATPLARCMAIEEARVGLAALPPAP